MIWKDTGYLVKLTNFSENSAVLTFLTHNHGLHNGVVYGANSKKKKNYLQIGNKFTLNWKSKSEDSMGYYNLELENSNAAQYFDNPSKLLFILSISEICCKVLAERYDYNSLYEFTDFFFKNIISKHAHKFYIEWEMELLKAAGYEININNDNFNFSKNHNNEWLLHIDEKKFFYPNFLIDSSEDYTDRDLYNGLLISKFILNKFIFEPNKIRFPIVRNRLEKMLHDKI